MPDVTEIPPASVLQQQLALIEQALASLNAGGASITAMTITAAPPGLDTRCIIDPGLSDPTTITNVTTLLQTQQTYLIQQLQNMGFSYTGSAIPTAVVSPDNVRAPTPPPPLPPIMPESPVEPPPLPAADPEDPPVLPPMDSGSPPPSPL